MNITIQTTNRTYHAEQGEIMDAWRHGNDAGEGYAVGEDNQSPSEAADEDGLLEQGNLDPTGNIVAVSGDRVIAICDHNGPWAVDITDALDALID